ncbi:MAG: hypothetical protein HC849_10540 [Oscillatoriales cyanobacterium RU_3_3]|nr:hypothetical protein [Oscillatoriales cyanobacterium RU_3_3]
MAIKFKSLAANWRAANFLVCCTLAWKLVGYYHRSLVPIATRKTHKFGICGIFAISRWFGRCDNTS